MEEAGNLDTVQNGLQLQFLFQGIIVSCVNTNMTRCCTVSRCKGRSFLLLGLVAQDEILLEDVQKLGVGAALVGQFILQ